MNEQILMTNMVKLGMSEEKSVIIRPSGTESKVKVYVSIKAKGETEALEQDQKIMRMIESI